MSLVSSLVQDSSFLVDQTKINAGEFIQAPSVSTIGIARERDPPIPNHESTATKIRFLRMPPSLNPAQTLTLRTFTILHTLRQNWGGELILFCGLNPDGAALALASNIAGAVCLSIEEDPKNLKDALRSGSCDFIVNTLDEALRTMKNEVRKHLPLSVGLQGNPSAVLEELLARGVSPELFTDFTADSRHDKPARQFKLQGAIVLNFSSS